MKTCINKIYYYVNLIKFFDKLFIILILICNEHLLMANSFVQAMSKKVFNIKPKPRPDILGPSLGFSS